MFETFTQRLTSLFFPIVLLVACAVAFTKIGAIPEEWRSTLVEVLPILGLVIGLIVSLQFNRSRYTFLLIFLTGAAISIVYFKEELGPNALNLLFAGLFINAFIFSLSKDRSLFSSHGALRIVFLAFQAQILWVLLIQFPEVIDKAMSLEVFTLPVILEHYLKMSDILLIIGATVTALHFLLIFVLGNSTIQATFFGCQIGLIGIASGHQSDLLVPLILAACCIMVCISIFANSYDMAYRDELTGLPSRRALNQFALSLGRRYTIAMLDIDHFKKFNDTHGHDVGDDVLRMVASKIGKITGGGTAFRYGGEEFTIIFPRKSAHQVEAHLDSLRKTIEHYAMVPRAKKRPPEKHKNKKHAPGKSEKDKKPQKTLSVTISIGIAERTNDHKTPDEVIKSADEALYRAKKKGRNCVSL